MPFFIKAHIAAAAVGHHLIFLKTIADIISVSFDRDPHPFADVIGDLGAVAGQA